MGIGSKKTGSEDGAVKSVSSFSILRGSFATSSSFREGVGCFLMAMYRRERLPSMVSLGLSCNETPRMRFDRLSLVEIVLHTGSHSRRFSIAQRGTKVVVEKREKEKIKRTDISPT